MPVKKIILIIISSILIVCSHGVHANSQLSKEKIVELLRVQTDADAAKALLKSIDTSIVYQDVFEMLDAGLIVNAEYPIPNELVNRLLQQFKQIEQYNMEQFVGTMSMATNENFNLIEAVKIFIQHEKLDDVGYLKSLRIFNERKDTMSVDAKKHLFTTIQESRFGQDESLLDPSFKEEIQANILFFLMGKNDVIEDELSELFFDHLQKTDDDQIKGIVSGFHKGEITHSNYQEALSRIVTFDNCLKRCQAQVIQLVTYNEEIQLTDPDRILMLMALRSDTTDYILGELTMPTWDARRPLSEPTALLKAIKSAKNYGPEAKLKMKQASGHFKEESI